jgi:Flp pilus assembly protein TadG
VTRASLARDERGAVAIAVALMLPVLIGAGAFAVDVSHSRLVENRLQSAADAAALAAVQDLSDQPAAVARAIRYAELNAPAGFGEITAAEDVVFGAYDPAEGTFTPSTVDVNAIRVTARRDGGRGNAAPSFLGAIFGADGIDIGASAIAARTITSVYQPPELINLSPEAADYNEVHAYCFDFTGEGTAASRRSQMTKIAHNITPPVSGYVWPDCPEGQSLSFRLYNVRNARTNPTKRANPPARDVYNHYSDTILEDGRETFDFGGRAILETVRCDTFEACRPTNQGGVLPFGRNRTPNREERPCVPGKFMYFGWEDRPPGMGSSDRDYDDILFVMRCPTGLAVTYGAARLVQ